MIPRQGEKMTVTNSDGKGTAALLQLMDGNPGQSAAWYLEEFMKVCKADDALLSSVVRDACQTACEEVAARPKQKPLTAREVGLMYRNI
jgi:hypothetical protein